jgi:hypothetical protein
MAATEARALLDIGIETRVHGWGSKAADVGPTRARAF